MHKNIPPPTLTLFLDTEFLLRKTPTPLSFGFCCLEDPSYNAYFQCSPEPFATGDFPFTNIDFVRERVLTQFKPSDLAFLRSQNVRAEETPDSAQTLSKVLTEYLRTLPSYTVLIADYCGDFELLHRLTPDRPSALTSQMLNDSFVNLEHDLPFFYQQMNHYKQHHPLDPLRPHHAYLDAWVLMMAWRTTFLKNAY